MVSATRIDYSCPSRRMCTRIPYSDYTRDDFRHTEICQRDMHAVAQSRAILAFDFNERQTSQAWVTLLRFGITSSAINVE